MKLYFVLTFAVILALVIGYWLTRGPNTIEYTDYNKNGVWDDVEPFIKTTAKTRNQRKALEFEMVEYQKRLLNPNLGVVERESEGPIPDGLTKSDQCIDKVWGGYGKLDYRLVQNAILTSWSRHRAWAKYNANLSGGIYTLWDEERHGNPCPFELEKK